MCAHAVCIFLSEVIILALKLNEYFWLNVILKIIRNVDILLLLQGDINETANI